jgi:hypothetical protein
MPRTPPRCGRARRLLAGAVLALLIVGFAPLAARGNPSEEARVVSMINGLRSRHGVRPVAVHGELRALANDWAQRMRDAVNYFHSPLADRVTANWITVGENVGAEAGVVEIQRAFEASPGHLATLVDPRFNYVGIGVAWGPDGTIYVVQDFMELAESAPSAPTASGSAQLPRRTPAPRSAAPATRSAAATPAPAPPPPPPPPEPTVYLSTVLAQLQTLDAHIEERLVD